MSLSLPLFDAVIVGVYRVSFAFDGKKVITNIYLNEDRVSNPINTNPLEVVENEYQDFDEAFYELHPIRDQLAKAALREAGL